MRQCSVGEGLRVLDESLLDDFMTVQDDKLCVEDADGEHVPVPGSKHDMYAGG